MIVDMMILVSKYSILGGHCFEPELAISKSFRSTNSNGLETEDPSRQTKDLNDIRGNYLPSPLHLHRSLIIGMVGYKSRHGKVNFLGTVVHHMSFPL